MLYPGYLFSLYVAIFLNIRRDRLFQELVALGSKVEEPIILMFYFFLFPLFSSPLSPPPPAIPGKLPPPTTSLEYSLEYGSDSMEISTSISASISGRDVILVDDLLATGGTMSAAEQLVEHVGGRVRLCVVVIELPEIGGRKKLKAPLQSLVQFEGD